MATKGSVNELFNAISAGDGIDMAGKNIVEAPERSLARSTTTPGLGSRNRIQRLYLTLPVSKTKIECSLVEIDPDECGVSSFNKRSQALLSKADPGIQTLMSSIKNQKQRDPVLIRPAIDPSSKFKYELIYGSRRRFCISQLNKEEAVPVLLKAWISAQIPDIDARRLAHAENEGRQDISAWEQALYIRSYLQANPNRQAVAAEELGVQQSAISRYLKLSNLPESVVSLLSSPGILGLHKGIALHNRISELKSERGEVMEKLKAQAPFTRVQDLMLSINEALNEIRGNDRGPSPLHNKIKIIGHGQSKIVISRHPTDEGRFRADFSGMRDYDVRSLVEICCSKWGT